MLLLCQARLRGQVAHKHDVETSLKIYYFENYFYVFSKLTWFNIEQFYVVKTRDIRYKTAWSASVQVYSSNNCQIHFCNTFDEKSKYEIFY